MRSRVFEMVLSDSLKNFEMLYAAGEEFGTLVNNTKIKEKVVGWSSL